MDLKKRIINEPAFQIREAARKAMKGRMGLLIMSAAIFMLCMEIPVIIVEQITGLWDVFERALEDYAAVLVNPTYAAMNDFTEAYYDKFSVSFASYIFLLVVTGPLELGLSIVWLRVLRGKEAYADMVFSGFGNFLLAMLLGLVRSIFIAIWSLLLVVPGVIAYYRYSTAFFILADNPATTPFAALTQSKYYMQGNKGSRFYLDLTFLGWFALSGIVTALVNNIVSAAINYSTSPSLFIQFIISSLIGSVIIAPVCAYRGVAAAEYYHRVICRDPRI